MKSLQRIHVETHYPRQAGLPTTGRIGVVAIEFAVARPNQRLGANWNSSSGVYVIAGLRPKRPDEVASCLSGRNRRCPHPPALYVGSSAGGLGTRIARHARREISRLGDARPATPSPAMALAFRRPTGFEFSDAQVRFLERQLIDWLAGLGLTLNNDQGGPLAQPDDSNDREVLAFYFEHIAHVLANWLRLTPPSSRFIDSIIAGERTCSSCKERKPPDDFGSDKSRCLACAQGRVAELRDGGWPTNSQGRTPARLTS